MSEPATLKLFEHSYYIGIVFNAIIYGTCTPLTHLIINVANGLRYHQGINLTIYFAIVQNLLKNHKGNGTIMKQFHAVFSTVMILLMTICLSAGAVWGEEMWITARDKPGGVLLFLVTETDVWYQAFGRACTFIMIFFADLFLVRQVTPCLHTPF